jgi:hypothetical protein
VRDKTRLAGLAQRLRSSTGRSVDTVAADPNDAIVRIRKTTICGADLQHQTSESRPTDSFCGEVSYRFTIKPTTVCFSSFCTDLFQLAALNID